MPRRRKPVKVYSLFGDYRIEVFGKRNPVEALIGGKVRIRKQRGR
jgi:hypothetical protein